LPCRTSSIARSFRPESECVKQQTAGLEQGIVTAGEFYTGKIQKFKMREISIRELGLEDVAKIKMA